VYYVLHSANGNLGVCIGCALGKLGSRTTVLADCELIRQSLCGTSPMDTETQHEHDEMAVVSELML